jgi:broad specificity phosphatase PhoE
MSLTIYFLRHGEATHNVAATQKGDAAYNDPAYTDAQLTDTGFEQSHNVALESHQLSAIYCSPLRRCRDTLLTAIDGVRYRHVFLDDRLMEPQGHICNRRLERDNIVREIGDMPWRLQGVAVENPYRGSEAYDNFCRRIIAFTDQVIAFSKEANHNAILIVSHHEWIRTWFTLYKQKQVSPTNAQVLVATI